MALCPDKLLGVGDEHYREVYKPEKFIEELHATDMFDLLIGTSTGSILSFGMGYKGLSPQVSVFLSRTRFLNLEKIFTDCWILGTFVICDQ